MHVLACVSKQTECYRMSLQNSIINTAAVSLWIVRMNPEQNVSYLICKEQKKNNSDENFSSIIAPWKFQMYCHEKGLCWLKLTN